jgi:hypothetical protein
MKLVWVTDAKYESGFKIRLQFNDGITGIVDLENSLKGKVFEPLKNVDYFKNFSTNSWTIEWENGADFAPEYLYHLINQNNENKF